jgi:hypothetical protein
MPMQLVRTRARRSCANSETGAWVGTSSGFRDSKAGQVKNGSESRVSYNSHCSYNNVNHLDGGEEGGGKGGCVSARTDRPTHARPSSNTEKQDAACVVDDRGNNLCQKEANTLLQGGMFCLTLVGSTSCFAKMFSKYTRLVNGWWASNMAEASRPSPSFMNVSPPGWSNPDMSYLGNGEKGERKVRV